MIMSAFWGIYNLDGLPVDDLTLARVEKGLITRGPGGGGQFKAGPIAMVYRAFHTHRESRLEKQPLVSGQGHVLCWDGRLDNREKLICDLREQLEEDLTDVAIVMAAYLKWGIDFLPMIIGDFALSLWDPTSRSLMLA